MTEHPHRLLLASAGTGKTYRLSARFIELLLDGVEPSKVLATTFTRKAAGEILQKVLVRLCDAAERRKDLDDLRKALRGRAVEAEDCRRVLLVLLRALERLRVSTLDGFFAGVARSCALDLGLPAAWTIVDEETARELGSEALSTALSEAQREEITAVLAALQQDAAKRAVHAALFSAIEGGSGLVHESGAAAWDRLRVPANPSDEVVKRAVDALERLPVPKTGKGAENKNWVKAREDLVATARAGDWEGLIQRGLVKKVLAGESEYYGAAVSDAWVDALEPLIARARSVVLAALVRENRASRAWFERFEQHLERLRRERGGLRFEDLPRAIAPLRGDPLVARGVDLWFRLDGQVDHVLLDEFQDTSPSQWRCLRRLAEEILADGTSTRSFFCVGDVKQSIYGWRGAEPGLLECLPGRYAVLAPPEKLQRSWRSSQVVLDAVNEVFGTIGTSRVFDGKREKHRPAARRFQDRFGAHEAAKELPGAALLLEARPVDDAKGEEEHAPSCELAVERVAQLHAEEPEATIAILLRRNAWIPRLLHALSERGIRASGEGGNPVTDGAAVTELCSLLLLADHPSDTACAFHVAHSPLAAALGLEPGDEEGVGQKALEARRAIAARGYGPWLADLHAKLRAAKSHGAWDLERFGQLVELGFAYDARATLRPGDFVRHVERARVEDPSASRVKILTVHAAKGLEYDAVILPELDASLAGRPTRFDWERAQADGEITLVSRHVGEDQARLDAHLEALARTNGERRVEEALAVLYVAMTRAIHRLELIVPWRDPDDDPTLSCAGLVRTALGNGPADEHGVLWEHERNAERWYAPPERMAKAEAERDEVPVELALLPGARASERKTASGAKHGPVLSAALLLSAPDRFGTARGTLVHHWLASIEWLDGPPPDEAGLRALARGVEHDERVIRAALADFRAALGHPAIVQLLTRPAVAAGDELVVWRERPFAVHLPKDGGGEEFYPGSMDRVVLTRRGGPWSSAEILDWKTDHVLGDELAQRAEAYRPQLETYRRVLARQTGLAESSIRARLVFLHAGVARDV